MLRPPEAGLGTRSGTPAPGPVPSVPVQLGAGCILRLLLIEVPFLLVPGHNVQVVEVRVVVHCTAGGWGCQRFLATLSVTTKSMPPTDGEGTKWLQGPRQRVVFYSQQSKADGEPEARVRPSTEMEVAPGL